MTQSINLGAIANGSGASVRSGINNGFLAVVTESEGSSAPNPTYAYMLWRNNTSKLLSRRNAGNSGWEIIENYGATIDPTANDDIGNGYIEGSSWVNVTGNKWFVCTDQTTAAAIWREISAGGTDRIRVKSYGAIGDGTTSDQTAIQNAFTAAASANKLVDLGAGTYRCTAAITATNLRGVVGDGKSIAALVWDDTTDGGIAITYTGNFYRKCAIFKDFALRQKGRRGTALLLDYSAYSLTYPGPDARFVVERVVAEGTGNEGDFGWSIGFDALAGAYGTYRDCEFIGYHDNPAPASTAGFRFRGTGTQYDNGHPVVCHSINCMSYHATTAFHWDGCEGVIGRDCNAVNVGTGYLFDGGDLTRPQFVIDGCHANFHSNGIVCDAGVDVTLVNNLLYTISTTTQTDTTGIGIINAGSVSSVGHFLIQGNIFCDLKTTKAMTCIYAGTGTVASGVIDNNIFRSGKVGITLDTGTSSIQVGLYNIYTFLSSTAINNLGSGNIINKFDGNSAHYLDGTGVWSTPSGGGGGAPTSATYIVQTADATLTNEQALGSLSTGVLKVTTTTGVLSTAVANTDYAAATHAARHKTGGADSIKLDELAAPTDVTTLNVSTTAHGLMPKLNNNQYNYFTGAGTQTGLNVDANFSFTLSGSNPVINLDTGNDYAWYDRTNNRFSYTINNVSVAWIEGGSAPGVYVDANCYIGVSGGSSGTAFFTGSNASGGSFIQFDRTNKRWDFYIDGALAGHVNLATGFVND